MAGTGLQMAATRACVTHPQKMFTSSAALWGLEAQGVGHVKLGNSSCISSVQPLLKSFAPSPLKSNNVVTRAMASESGKSGSSRLSIDLRGNKILPLFSQ